MVQFFIFIHKAILKTLDSDKTAHIYIAKKICFCHLNWLHRLCILTLEHVIINDIGMLKITCLILISRILITEVNHSIIISNSKICTVNIKPLTELILIIEAVLTDLNLDTCSLVLNIKALVEVTHLIRCSNLTLNYTTACNLDRFTFVHSLKVSDTGKLIIEVIISINILVLRILIFSCEHWLKLLTSSEKSRSSK